MKLFVPILKTLPIEFGFGVKNPSPAGSDAEPQLLVKLWNGFEVSGEATVSFDSKRAIQVFLSEIFQTSQLNISGLATVEFVGASLIQPGSSFEIQLALRSLDRMNWASLLYDLIPDKKPGHRYSPILHSAHTAFVDDTTDSYVMMINFRPPYLKSEKANQILHLQIKTPEGELLSQRTEEIPFNSTSLFSFRDEFAKFEGFKPGSQLNLKGGESQFAIFTLFYNRRSHAVGIEHSLPPIYYCSSVYQPASREKFYKNAFRALDSKP